VTANSLAGCLLVLYEPDITLEDIIAAIEQHLDRDVRLRSKPTRSAAKDNPNFKQLFVTASGLLQRLPELLYSVPLFRPSPVQHAGNETTQAQNPDPWHLKDLDELLQILGTSRQKGLSNKETIFKDKKKAGDFSRSGSTICNFLLSKYDH
jgi:hypothetical protein